MRKLLVPVAVAAAALAAVPAAAQYHPGSHSGWNQRGPSRHAVGELRARLDRAEQRIQRSQRRGIISNREAFGLRRQANRIRADLRQALRNGLSGREFAALRFQVNRLEQRIRLERRDADRRRG